MRIHLTSCLALSLVGASCTSLDFFGFADDAPLLVMERPDGYSSSAFGAALVATGSSETDLLAISGGDNTQVAIFKLASNGALHDVSSPDSFYPNGPEAAAKAGAGSALASLPTWQAYNADAGALAPLEGCLAVGEPSGEEPSVRVICRADEREEDRLSPPSSASEEPLDPKGFGRFVASVRPSQGEAWLLAVGANGWLAVYGSGKSNDSTTPAFLDPDAPKARQLTRLAAGRAELPLPFGTDERPRFFVAASSTAKAGGEERVQLFVENGNRLEPAACLARPDEVGFGGSMIASDLNADGDDELVVSAAFVEGRAERVYIYDVRGLLEAALDEPGTCLEEAAPLATLAAPADFEGTSCAAGCGFGAALAAGQLATDDDGAELAIGAPGAKVHGQSGAGAVYLWRGADLVAGAASAPVAKVVDSAGEARDALGSALAIAPIAGRSELAIGAPGAGQALLAFCTNVGEDIEQGADVTKNGKGKVVSTHCRLK